ncbi:MAG: heavy metal translocating P-type ATPase [Gammaproteobacteria bacterium]|nr:heavy metal translocating P-type ATPase [Gammaproteobacteria bacterium]
MTGDLQSLTLPIAGMTCGACATRLEKTLARVTGIQTAGVNFAVERADISFDPSIVNIETITQAISNTGFSVPDEHYSFGVSGMTCSACSTRLEKSLSSIPGVLSAHVNLALERAGIETAAGSVKIDTLAQAVRNAGFKPILGTGMSQADTDQMRQVQQTRQLAHEKRIMLISVALSAPLVLHMILLFMGVEFSHPPVLELLLATIIQFVIGARFYKAAYNALRGGSANMDVLVVLGTTSAYLYSWYLLVTLGPLAPGKLYFEASAVIITLVLVGKYMEARAKRGTTAAIRQLMDLRPETARVRQTDNTEIQKPIAEVIPGDFVIVKPGERIPVDGVVVRGESEVDEALITGESIPVTKSVDDRVTGGAINGTGLLEVKTTEVGQDSTLARIIHLVENAQAGKAPVQRLVDRISAIFVPIVIVIAALTFASWYLSTGVFESALIAAVSVLVIACPCALGLATPTAIMTGTGAAARAGILIKDVESLERAHRLNAIIFDKTGTLTEGRPSVTQIHAIQGSEIDILQTAAMVQQGSEHPLAKAMLDRATELKLSLPDISEFKSHTGLGVTAVAEDQIIICGNTELLQKLGITMPDEPMVTRLEQQANTVVWVAKDKQAIGFIAIADTIRIESAAAIQSLHALNARTLMISGDAEEVAQRVGNEVGIDEVRGRTKPDQKADAVKELQQAGCVVGMIGDGINDAPALAAADVGIAMGTGTDVAMETAGITLMRSDPRLVAAAIHASRATFRKIKQNLFWAFIYNLIGIPLAAMGILTPTLAGAAMALSSVSVVSNSLLLRKWKPDLQDNPQLKNKVQRKS